MAKDRWPGAKQKRDKGPSSDFSESELDVALQLVQLRGNSDESRVASSPISAATRMLHGDGAESSSALRRLCPAEDVDDGHRNRRRRKFRSLRRVYESMDRPPSVSLDHAKKIICR